MSSVAEVKQRLDTAIMEAREGQIPEAREKLGELRVASAVEKIREAIGLVALIKAGIGEVPCEQIQGASDTSSSTVRQVMEGTGHDAVQAMYDQYKLFGDKAGEARAELNGYADVMDEAHTTLSGVVAALEEAQSGHLAQAEAVLEEAEHARLQGTEQGQIYMATL